MKHSNKKALINRILLIMSFLLTSIASHNTLASSDYEQALLVGKWQLQSGEYIQKDGSVTKVQASRRVTHKEFSDRHFTISISDNDGETIKQWQGTYQISENQLKQQYLHDNSLYKTLFSISKERGKLIMTQSGQQGDLQIKEVWARVM